MRGCRVETRRLGSVSQDTGRPRSDPGILIPRSDHGIKILRSGKLSRARHTSPPGKEGERKFEKVISTRWLPPPAPVSTFRPGSQHPKRSRNSPTKSKLPTWQAFSRPNPAFKKIKKTPCLNLILLAPELCKSKLAGHGPHPTGMRKVKTYEIPPKDKP